ncbi:MAG: hypothetical protein JSV49_09495 [Thermoplasmata archaeon]|nr:MAG: hypothetical protein JSV49_09495 [Thermoplasmata archaeon]
MPSRKSIKCPKCSELIIIPIVEDEKLFIECDSCGAKGRIKNPYRKPSPPERKKPTQESTVEEKIEEKQEEGEQPDTIECPKCEADITIPFSDSDTIRIACSECGAEGKVPNPNIEPKKGKKAGKDRTGDIEFIECPKCDSEIEIPYSEGERIIITCGECGAMGRINNPHMLREDLERDRIDEMAGESETELEHKRRHEMGGLIETISCPKCEGNIDVPYSTDPKLKIQCGSCGAKGRIHNPYL